MKLYVVPPLVRGGGLCKCRMSRGGYSPLLSTANNPLNSQVTGGAMKVDTTKVKSILSSGLMGTSSKKKYISI